MDLLFCFPVHCFLYIGRVTSVLEKILSQSTEQDNPSRLVIEAARGSATKVQELVKKFSDKVLFHCLYCIVPIGHTKHPPHLLATLLRINNKMHKKLLAPLVLSFNIGYNAVDLTAFLNKKSRHHPHS